MSCLYFVPLIHICYLVVFLLKRVELFLLALFSEIQFALSKILGTAEYLEYLDAYTLVENVLCSS